MDKEQALNLVRRYKEIIAEHFPLKAVYVYGSYSKGCQREDSDIDVAVIVERMNNDYLSDLPLLWRLRRKVSTLIEPVLLLDTDNNPLYDEVVSTGILL